MGTVPFRVNWKCRGFDVVHKRLMTMMLLVAGAVLLSATGVFAGCVTVDCHAIMGRAPVVHPPVADGDCESCHTATGQPHPGAGSMKLAADGRALCLNCHDDPAKGLPFVHPPVADGCVDCHNPHQSANAKLLLQPGGKLCLMCHDSVLSGKKVHGPVFAGNCAMCHTPHASANPMLMTQPGNDLCLACHAPIEKIIKQAKSQHEPVAKGRCWECHAPHSSDYEPLLRAYYPQDFYTSYQESNFALCFTCHDKNAFEYERTTEATGFRNRDRNLHYFHVNRPVKARVCKSCHGVHGADQGKLLLSKVPHFGNWDIPLRWMPTDNGAACYVGCHRPKIYDRSKRIDNP